MQPLHQGQSSLRPCSIDMELRGYEPSKPFVANSAGPKRKPFLMVRIKEAYMLLRSKKETYKVTKTISGTLRY